ncbi:MAG: hypothetical protein PHE67_04865 [Campylobacterales bacterium]|nr:hypothetical protein [Campylobacterales bacterium]
MPKIFSSNTILEAWLDAYKHLLDQNGGEDFNVIVEIKNVSIIENDCFKKYNPKRLNNGLKSTKDVANTIFPKKIYDNDNNRSKLYEHYIKVHEKASKRTKSKAWGTYFLRLISFGETKTNQLEQAIVKINSWKNNSKTAFIFHLSSPEFDNPRPLGGPCLQYIALHILDNTISMVAVYRNHDYFKKALGNFIGLSYLLEYICKETGKEMGSIICHSVHAELGATKKIARSLIE